MVLRRRETHPSTHPPTPFWLKPLVLERHSRDFSFAVATVSPSSCAMAGGVLFEASMRAASSGFTTRAAVFFVGCGDMGVGLLRAGRPGALLGLRLHVGIRAPGHLHRVGAGEVGCSVVSGAVFDYGAVASMVGDENSGKVVFVVVAGSSCGA